MSIETEARRLRAAIYGEISDRSWAVVAENWTRPDSLRWLRLHQTPPVCPPGLHWKTWNGQPDAPNPS